MKNINIKSILESLEESVNEENFMFTEQDMKTAMFNYAKWVTGGPPSLRFAKNADEAQVKIISNIKNKKSIRG